MVHLMTLDMTIDAVQKVGFGPAQGDIKACNSTPAPVISSRPAPAVTPTSSYEVKSQIENFESVVEDVKIKMNTMEFKVDNREHCINNFRYSYLLFEFIVYRILSF